MLLGGVFVADPADGFPPGTPPGPPATFTTSGLLHFLAAAIGFFSWIAACFVFARRFRAHGDKGWAVFSAGTGAFFLAAFLGAASGLGPVIGLVLAILLAWTWLSATFARLMQEASSDVPRAWAGNPALATAGG
jgi:hypothetical protein